MNRFYFSRRKDGLYHIIDRYIDLRIAKAEYREAAVQIVNSLNGEVPKVVWAHNHFNGDPPKGYKDWIVWMEAQTKAGAFIRALLPTEVANESP